MTFTKAIIEAVNGTNILALDCYGNSHHIHLTDVHYEDVELIAIGKDILINDTGLVENPSGAFNRWRDALESARTSDTRVIDE